MGFFNRINVYLKDEDGNYNNITKDKTFFQPNQNIQDVYKIRIPDYSKAHDIRSAPKFPINQTSIIYTYNTDILNLFSTIKKDRNSIVATLEYDEGSKREYPVENNSYYTVEVKLGKLFDEEDGVEWYEADYIIKKVYNGIFRLRSMRDAIMEIYKGVCVTPLQGAPRMNDRRRLNTRDDNFTHIPRVNTLNFYSVTIKEKYTRPTKEKYMRHYPYITKYCGEVRPDTLENGFWKLWYLEHIEPYIPQKLKDENRNRCRKPLMGNVIYRTNGGNILEYIDRNFTEEEKFIYFDRFLL